MRSVKCRSIQCRHSMERLGVAWTYKPRQGLDKRGCPYSVARSSMGSIPGPAIELRQRDARLSQCGFDLSSVLGGMVNRLYQEQRGRELVRLIVPDHPQRRVPFYRRRV